jgi:hypothetical protein
MVDFGQGPVASAGAQDVFVRKLAGASLLPLWTKHYGGAGQDEATAIAVDGASNVLVAGYFEGAMQVGPTPFTSEGDRDAFALKLGPAGENVFSKHFGAKEDDEGAGVAADGFGRILLTGFFRTTVDFGAGDTTSAGESDVFVATFDP